MRCYINNCLAWVKLDFFMNSSNYPRELHYTSGIPNTSTQTRLPTSNQLCVICRSAVFIPSMQDLERDADPRGLVYTRHPAFTAPTDRFSETSSMSLPVKSSRSASSEMIRKIYDVCYTTPFHKGYHETFLSY